MAFRPSIRLGIIVIIVLILAMSATSLPLKKALFNNANVGLRLNTQCLLTLRQGGDASKGTIVDQEQYIHTRKGGGEGPESHCDRVPGSETKRGSQDLLRVSDSFNVLRVRGGAVGKSGTRKEGVEISDAKEEDIPEGYYKWMTQSEFEQRSKNAKPMWWTNMMYATERILTKRGLWVVRNLLTLGDYHNDFEMEQRAQNPHNLKGRELLQYMHSQDHTSPEARSRTLKSMFQIAFFYLAFQFIMRRVLRWIVYLR